MPHSLAQIHCCHWDLGRFKGVCGEALGDRCATGSKRSLSSPDPLVLPSAVPCQSAGWAILWVSYRPATLRNVVVMVPPLRPMGVWVVREVLEQE